MEEAQASSKRRHGQLTGVAVSLVLFAIALIVNFIGDLRRCRELLHAIITWRRRTPSRAGSRPNTSRVPKVRGLKL